MHWCQADQPLVNATTYTPFGILFQSNFGVDIVRRLAGMKAAKRKKRVYAVAAVVIVERYRSGL